VPRKPKGKGKAKGVNASDWTEFQKWRGYQRRQAENDASGALAIADRATEPLPEEPKRNLQKAGIQRRTEYVPWKRTPLNGYSQKQSDVARMVVAMRLGGFALEDCFEAAAEEYELATITVKKYWYEKKELFGLAEIEHSENAIKKYGKNVAVCRTMLSDAGPDAVRTLVDVMRNPDASDSVRSKTAVAVLKMLDVDGSATGTKSEDIAMKSLNIAKAAMDREKEQDSHIITVEAETLKEDESETRA
jgi:hypothetical protein